MNDEMTPEERPSRRTRSRRPRVIKVEGGAVERGKSTQSSGRSRKPAADPAENLIAVLSQKVVGQPAATRVIVPYIQMY
ncbi:MAG: ATPase, partial [Bryobacteraceae bacterium]